MSDGSVAGVVLAGGLSTRMGRDKALLTSNGKTLVQHAVETLQAIFDEVLVVTNSQAVSASVAVPSVSDIIKQQGPMSGIHAGLSAIRADYAFCVACDMPRLNISFIEHLAKQASGVDVVVPRIDGQVEGMHAVYSKKCIAPIEQALREGRRKLISFYDDVRVRYIEREECEQFDSELWMFANVNTPEEWKKMSGERVLD